MLFQKLPLTFLLFLLMGFISVNAQALPVPHSLRNKAVYYERVRQLNNFCCGYNALYNACKLEQKLGIANPYSDVKRFENLCLPYIASRGYRPKDNAYTHIIKELSVKLNLTHLESVGLRGRNNNSLIVHSCYHPDQTMQALKQKLNAPSTRTKVIHFVCIFQLPNGPHGVLVSLVKDSQEQISLHLFDNLNNQLTEGSELKRCIDALITYFGVSSIPVNNSSVLSKPVSTHAYRSKVR